MGYYQLKSPPGRPAGGRVARSRYLRHRFPPENAYYSSSSRSTISANYIWRAVDQDGDVIDILVLVQPRRDGRAARRCFRKLLNSQRQEPFRIVTDKLGSYRVAHRAVMPLVTHDTARHANNRVEGLPSTDTAKRAIDARLQISRPGSAVPACSRRHSESLSTESPPAEAVHHRMLRARSFATWASVTAA